MAISKELIFSAADELTAAGQRPTLEAVRQKIGGSYTTISPALKEWKALQARASEPAHEPVPQAVSESLAAVGSDLWKLALELAATRFADERAQMEKARTEVTDEWVEAMELADKLNAELDALRSQLAQQQAAAVDERQHMAAQLAAAHAERDQAVSAATQTREEAAGLVGQIAALKEQCSALLGRLEPAPNVAPSAPRHGVVA